MRQLGRIVLVGAAGLALVRLAGLDTGTMLSAPVALLPLAALPTAAVLVLFLRHRSRWWSAAAAVVLLVQLVWLVPRFVPDRTGAPPGVATLRVGTVNAFVSQADPAALVAFVREQRLDVLAVQELYLDAAAAVDRAGMRTLMPYRELHPEIDTSLYSRLPLNPGRLGQGGLLTRPTTWPQTTAEVQVGPRTVTLIGVHTYYPLGNAGWWTRDLAELAVAAGQAGPDLIMLGDFNASVDHAPMRTLLDTGLVDVNAELGHGWAPTWPADRIMPPLVQLDHVLHGPGLAAIWAGRQRVPGSDHLAVVADLVLLP
ncbi:MAG TPA: endonuclease/exonuclease/phosphatase family protein [Micromonosporaceae bacterium]